MSQSKKLSRREFLLQSIILGGAGYSVFQVSDLWRRPSILGANDRLRVGIIGLGRRGFRHLQEYMKLPNVEIAALCDTNKNALQSIAADLSRAGLPRPQMTTDYRRLLDLSQIDVLSIATPKNTRTEIGVEACLAGKHLLMEKPFSASFEGGKKLVETAEKNRCLVQQRETQAFAPVREISSMLPYDNLQDFTSVRGWKRIKGTAFSKAQPQRNSHGEISYDKLLESALDELDAARCILDVEMPTQVISAGFNNPSSQLPDSLILQFNFDKERKRSINFELKIYQNSRGEVNTARDREELKNKLSAVDDEEFESQCVFFNSRGKFTVACSSSFENPETENNSWTNLVSCVREDDQTSLQNPIREAQKSCSLLHLAALSLRRERNLELQSGNDTDYRYAPII